MSTSELNDSDSRDRELDRAIMEFLRSNEDGSPLDISALLEKHAAVADELEAFINQQIQFGKITSPVRQFSSLTGNDAQEPIQAFGDYDIIREIGRGGMGVIYEARQRGLSRRVALKMIRDARFQTQADLARFQSESEAAAALEHPNIVPVYRVGSSEGQPFFTMKLVRGGSLKEALEEGPMTPTESARIALAIARGVSFAHQRLILHRDLKPANILLDSSRAEGSSSGGDTIPKATTGQDTKGSASSDGLPVPMISDFGLAKQLDDERDLGLTMTGAVLGTPKFMAPEQALGKATTTATDIYAVGAILYNMLTGEPPFSGNSPAEVARKVVDQTPKLIGWRTRIDLDLETICMKCLEKNPADRYGSASELAEDLENWIEGKPINARRSSTFEQVGKWARRHPRFATLLTASAALLMLTLIGAITFSFRLNAEVRKREATLRSLKGQEAETSRQRDLALHSLFESKFAEVSARRSSGDNGQQFGALAAAKEAVAQLPFIDVSTKEIFELRSETAGCLGNADIAQSADWLIDDFSTQQINSFSSDLALFVHHPKIGAPVEVYKTTHLDRDESINKSTPIALLDIGNEINTGFRGQVSRCARYVALNTARWEGHTRILTEHIFDIVDSKTILQKQDVGFACFGQRDSETLLAISNPERVSIFRLPDLKMIAEYRNPSPSSNNQMSFSPDGKWLARFGRGGVFVIDVETGKMVWENHDFTTYAGMDLDWHPGGKEVVIAKQTYFQIWNLEPTPRLIRTFPRNTNVVYQVEYAAGGSVVAASTWGDNTRFWDTQSGEQICSFAGTIDRVADDGQTFGFCNVVSGICQFDSGRSRRTISEADPSHMGSQPMDLDVHPNDRWVAMGDRKSVRICDLKTGVRLAEIPGEGRVRFHPDGKSLFIGGPTLNRWPINEEINSDGSLELTLGPPEKVNGIDPRLANFYIDVDPTGKWLAFIADKQATFLVNLQDKDARPIHIRKSPNIGGISVSANGRLVAVGNHHSENGHVFDGTTGEFLFSTPTPSHARCTLSPNGELLAVTYNSTADVYDTETRKRLYSLDGIDIEVGWPSSFSKDGELLLFTLRKPRGTLVVGARSGNRLIRIPGAAGTAPRDTRSLLTNDLQLVTIKDGNSLESWDLATIRNRLSEIGLDWDANRQPVSTRIEETVNVPTVNILWGDSRWSAYEKALTKLTNDWSWDVAEQAFEGWLRDYPDDPDLWHAKAVAKSRLGDPSALQDIDQALIIDDAKPELHLSHAKISRKLNAREHIISNLTSFLDLAAQRGKKSNRMEAVQMLAWEMGLQGELQHGNYNAAELAEASFAWVGQQELAGGDLPGWLNRTFQLSQRDTLSQNRVIAVKTLALALLRSGEPEKARTLIQGITPSTLRRLPTTTWGVGFILAACEADLGNRAKALEHFENELEYSNWDTWTTVDAALTADWSKLKSIAKEKLALDTSAQSPLRWSSAELLALCNKDYGTLAIQFFAITNRYVDVTAGPEFEKDKPDRATNLYWRSREPNHVLQFDLDIATAGKYDGKIHLVHSWDYGAFEFEINGKPVGRRFDGQANEVVFGDYVDFVDVELRKGNNRLTVKNVGKSGASTGFFLGIDSLEFTLK